MEFLFVIDIKVIGLLKLVKGFNMQVLLINGSKKFGNGGARLNATLQSVAKEFLESKGYKVLETVIDKGYIPQEEITKFKESNLIIYQMPAWWMGEPWIVKKYIDEVYGHGVSILFENDGRSRADESLKYGSGGLAKDKKVMLSVTWNAPKGAFIESNGFFEGVGVEGVYLHLRKIHEFCGMEWLPIFMCNDVVKNPQVQQYISEYKGKM